MRYLVFGFVIILFAFVLAPYAMELGRKIKAFFVEQMNRP